MKLDRLALTALGLAVALSACSDADAAPEGATTDLTRTLLEQPSSDGVSTMIPSGPSVTDEGGPRIRVSAVGINRGSVEAPVKVVEMSDYGCGYCRQFHQESFPAILAEFIETGMVEWKFVPYITGMWETSFPATSAAECAYQQDVVAFERLNSRLWDDQREWKGSGGQAAGIVRGWASEVGLDMATFDSCLAGDEQVRRIAEATRLAAQLAVRGTPTFIVIGADAYPPIQGALPLDAFRQILTVVHGEAVGSAGAGEPR
jgi:protein-disulfide isomerase